jgi:hypothetical protein
LYVLQTFICRPSHKLLVATTAPLRGSAGVMRPPTAIWYPEALVGRSTFLDSVFCDLAISNMVYLDDFWRTELLSGDHKGWDVHRNHSVHK